MGDRGNIKVYQGENSKQAVYLYSHYDGSDMCNILHKALSRNLRHDDHFYLTRIIFCELVKNDVNGELGYGIATSRADNQHTILGVNTFTKTITFERENWETGKVKVFAKMTFEDFLKDKDTRDKLFLDE